MNGVNVTGLREKSREVVPLKGGTEQKDLNRFLVADPDEANYDPHKTIQEQVDRHDIIIDIHSSPALHNHCMLIDFSPNAFPYIQWCIDSKIHYAVRYSDENTIKKYAISKGKIGVTFELNGVDFIDQHSANIGATHLFELLVNFSQETFEKQYVGVLKPFVELTSEAEGILVFPHVLDFSGRILCDVTRTQPNFQGNGALLYYKDTGSFIKKGEVAFAMQPEVALEVINTKPTEQVNEAVDGNTKT